MNITTYQSTAAWPNKRWLAHMELAPNCYMDFFGATEQEAKEKAQSFYSAEIDRQARLVAGCMPERTSNEPRLINNNLKGKGQYAIGKIWMLNHATKQKVRVLPSEIATYVANGFIRGGARSQFS